MGLPDWEPIEFEPNPACEHCVALKATHSACWERFTGARDRLALALAGRDPEEGIAAGEAVKEALIEIHLAEATIVRHLKDHVDDRERPV